MDWNNKAEDGSSQGPFHILIIWGEDNSEANCDIVDKFKGSGVQRKYEEQTHGAMEGSV